MKQFIPVENNAHTFSSCEICPAKCCNGKEGTVFAQITLDDFNAVHKNFPILFIYGELGYLKPVVLLTNGLTFCRHLKDFRCTIYEERPNICRVYPLSPHIDNNIYIDELCPAVNDKDHETQLLIGDSQIASAFDVSSLHNYQDQYIKTHFEMENFNEKKDFSLVITVNGINFYKCDKTYENIYMQMHQKSLEHLQDEYFIN